MLHLKTIYMANLQPALLEISPDPKLWVRGRWIHLPPSALAASFDGKGLGVSFNPLQMVTKDFPGCLPGMREVKLFWALAGAKLGSSIALDSSQAAAQRRFLLRGG